MKCTPHYTLMAVPHPEDGTRWYVLDLAIEEVAEFDKSRPSEEEMRAFAEYHNVDCTGGFLTIPRFRLEGESTQ